MNGVSELPTGIQFPIANGYVRLDRALREAAVGTVAVGGVTYGVYLIAEAQESK